eukprot:139240-Pyramimonas_sp.AAC.1
MRSAPAAAAYGRLGTTFLVAAPSSAVCNAALGGPSRYLGTALNLAPLASSVSQTPGPSTLR